MYLILLSLPLVLADPTRHVLQGERCLLEPFRMCKPDDADRGTCISSRPETCGGNASKVERLTFACICRRLGHLDRA